MKILEIIELNVARHLGVYGYSEGEYTGTLRVANVGTAALYPEEDIFTYAGKVIRGVVMSAKNDIVKVIFREDPFNVFKGEELFQKKAKKPTLLDKIKELESSLGAGNEDDSDEGESEEDWDDGDEYTENYDDEETW